jgi:ATP-dependent phosphofructokinase / diphosphate-dependent phosphofructokinase
VALNNFSLRNSNIKSYSSIVQSVMKKETMKDSVAILCAGGPAPGINTVISAVTMIFLQNGYSVLGINGGYKSMFAAEPYYDYLDFEFADQIYSRGGSALKMSSFS